MEDEGKLVSQGQYGAQSSSTLCSKMLEPYDVIASLGDWCAPAMNIRRRTGVVHTMPFDWLSCPYDSTIRMIEERFANILNLENLELVVGENGEQDRVRCRYYGILHSHDFELDEQKRIKGDLESQLLKVKKRYKFIIEYFLNSFSGKRTAFIRNSLYSGFWNPDVGPFIPPSPEQQFERATRLHSSLRELISPSHLDIVVLSNVKPGTVLPLNGGSVIFEQLGARKGDKFFWDENYDDLFDRLGLRL